RKRPPARTAAFGQTDWRDVVGSHDARLLVPRLILACLPNAPDRGIGFATRTWQRNQQTVNSRPAAGGRRSPCQSAKRRFWLRIRVTIHRLQDSEVCSLLD